MNKNSSTSIKRDLLSGLSCSKESWLISKLLNDQLRNENSDTLFTLSNLAVKPQANLITWNFVKNNWNYLYNR
jgi:hypothetical protein